MDWLAVLIVFLVAPLPLVEMRLGIMLGEWRYHLGPITTFGIVAAANLLIIPLLWAVATPAERGLRKSVWLSHRLDWLFAKTRKETTKGKKAVEELSLFVIVALTGLPIPIPGSGLYTALVAAYLFGIPLRKSFPFLAAGVVVAVAALSLEASAGQRLLHWI